MQEACCDHVTKSALHPKHRIKDILKAFQTSMVQTKSQFKLTYVVSAHQMCVCAR